MYISLTATEIKHVNRGKIIFSKAPTVIAKFLVQMKASQRHLFFSLVFLSRNVGSDEHLSSLFFAFVELLVTLEIISCMTLINSVDVSDLVSK